MATIKSVFNLTVADLLTSNEGINNLASLIKAEGKKLDRNIQIVLASACVLAHETGRFELINTCIDSLSAGTRTNAARGYAEKFGPVRWNKKEKAFVWDASKRLENIKTNPEHADFLNELLKSDWLDFAPEKEFKPVDAIASLEALIRRLKKVEEEKNDLHDVSKAQIDALEVVLAKMRSDKAVAVLADTSHATAEQEPVEA